VTPLAALRARLGSGVELRHVPALTDCRSSDASEFEKAVAAAEACEVTLAFVGEPANLSGEARSRAFLNLPGAQTELLERLARTGKPLVAVFMAGRPLVIGGACRVAQAALYAWHGGTMTGPALADVLFGDTPPSGKLPITFPRAVGQIPIYYNFKNTGRPPKLEFRGIPTGTALDPVDFDASYLDVEVTPEFPFGFGLSYTSFEYRELSVTPARFRRGERVTIQVEIRNTGTRSGDEIVQLYVRDLVGSVTRPVRELKRFRRVRLEPGASERVEFVLSERDLEFCGRGGEMQSEMGRYEVFVGGDSRASLTAAFELI
jgi:beta-glucosidase